MDGHNQTGSLGENNLEERPEKFETKLQVHTFLVKNSKYAKYAITARADSPCWAQLISTVDVQNTTLSLPNTTLKEEETKKQYQGNESKYFT